MNMYNRVHWTHLKMPGVTVSVTPRPDPRAAVFQVRSVIDDGAGRHTVVLCDPEFLILETEYLMEPQRVVPPKLGDMNLVYTGRFAMHIPNLHKALADFYKNAKVERIVPDVLEPGDFIVFRRGRRGEMIQMVETLRVMTEKKRKRYQTPYAV